MPIEQVDTVREMAEITQTYTTAIAVVAVFMVMVLGAFGLFLLESKAERKLEREEREADRQAKAALDSTRIKREDDNTMYWREAIGKMTAAVTASNAMGERIEQTLQKTHDVHDELSQQVVRIMEEIAVLRLEIAQRDATRGCDNERIVLMLERMESALGKILEERNVQE